MMNVEAEKLIKKNIFHNGLGAIFLSSADGKIKSVNQLAAKLLDEVELIDELLPSDHSGLVRACLKTKLSLKRQCELDGLNIIWSYQTSDRDDFVYITVQRFIDSRRPSKLLDALVVKNQTAEILFNKSSDIQAFNSKKSTFLHELNLQVEETSLVLWIDLRYNREAPVVAHVLDDIYRISVVSSGDDINKVIEHQHPDMICFDYDLPDQVGLSILSDIKCRNLSVPFIMLTEDHSTELAIWALRLRAWDYFIKPISTDELISSVAMLFGRLSSHAGRDHDNFMLKPQVPSGSRPYKSKSKGLSTVYAVDYVRQNLANKITVEETAKLCCMSKSHFSRMFKKEHGATFQNFLIQQRMNKAVELLKNSDLPVTQVAYTVGYCELSNFTSAFQRMIGIQPSSFCKALMLEQ